MNLDTTLSFVQDARAFLTTWGLGSTSLLVILALGIICFAFTMREVLSWYLRTQEMRDEVRELRKEIFELKAMLEDIETEGVNIPEPGLKSETAQLQFRLDH